MLRKRISASSGEHDIKTKRQKSCNLPITVPLGSKKAKHDTEKQLESLVLGGEEQLIDALTKTDEVYKK